MDMLQIIFVGWIVLHIIRIAIDYFYFDSKNIVLLMLVLSFISLLCCLQFSLYSAAILQSTISIVYYWIIKPNLVKMDHNET